MQPRSDGESGDAPGGAGVGFHAAGHGCRDEGSDGAGGVCEDGGVEGVGGGAEDGGVGGWCCWVVCCAEGEEGDEEEG